MGVQEKLHSVEIWHGWIQNTDGSVTKRTNIHFNLQLQPLGAVLPTYSSIVLLEV